MQIKKVSKILKKINNLHKSFLEDDDVISSIEKELLLSYIERLYITVVDGDESFESLIVSPVSVISNTVSETTLSDQGSDKKDIVNNQIVKELEETSSVVGYDGSKTVVEDDLNIVEEVVIEKEIEPIKEEVSEVEVESIESKSIFNVPSKMSVLFEPIEVKELSAKLANAPINSIKAKLGINEKLLTVKELFANEQESFSTVIDKLDSFASFDDAKDYLAKNVVDKYDWLSDTKIKKAIRFTQLIQRRYL